jgi:N-acetylmuramoyl-L-alanine amidase
MSMPGLPRLRRLRAAPPAAPAACLALAFLWLAAVPAPAWAQDSARDLYLAAQARERAVRAALDASPPDPPPTRDAMRQVVAAYRQVVLRFPASGYCDNALWLAAQLSADTFVRHGDERDRSAALQLLKALASEYPTSPLVARARADLARVASLTSDMETAAVPLPAPSAPARPDAPVQKPAATAPAASADKSADAAEAGGENDVDAVLVRDVRRRATVDGGIVEIELEGPVQYREERLDNPSRIFFDLAKTRTMEALRDAALSFESGPIRQVRIGRRPNSTTRVVVETADGCGCVSRMVTGPNRLVVTCVSNAAAAASPAAPALQPREAEPPTPVVVAPATAAESAARPARLPAPPPTEAPAPAAPSANGRGGFSMARQLGLRVGRIVIDAGHGGRDPGAPGPGYSEAALTLDIAMRLEKLLEKEPGVEVVLTRRTDEYVALQERTAIANREGADLFLSIHANASRNRAARGVESYLLNFASTPDAAAVAARENASSTLTMSHLNDLVKQIALNSKLDESRDLAGDVQNAMVRKLRSSNQEVKDLGVKQAPFVVLVGASMPSVLVEVSFLTHKQEGRMLGTGAYRQRIAEALLDGVRRYLKTLKRAATDAAGDRPGGGATVPAGLQ